MKKPYSARIGLVALAGAVLLASGCATSGRYVVLKEYQAQMAPDDASPMRGKKVFVEKFDWESNAPANQPTTDSIEPPGFAYVEMTPEHGKAWATLNKSARKAFVNNDAMVVGNVRNGFGKTLSKVYAMSDPGQWIREVVELEVVNQGATLAETPADADLVVSGAVKWLMADLYMKIWCNMVTVVDLAPKDKPAISLPIHTSGSQTAWTGSSSEYYTVIRQSIQKMMLLALPEMSKAVQP